MHITTFLARNIVIDDRLLPLVECDAVCAFSGEPLTRGVKTSIAIKETFTDRAYLRYPSEYISREAYICIGVLNYGGKVRKNSKEGDPAQWQMRSYSFLATDTEFRVLQRSDWMALICAPPAPPFALSFTESNKKHRSFKTAINYDRERYTVRMDTLDVDVDMRIVRELQPVMQGWYSIVPQKRDTAAAPTYFTKDEIAHGSTNHNRITAYGLERYFAENEYLNQHRNSTLFHLLLEALQKL
jgi:hypothetical protein